MTETQNQELRSYVKRFIKDESDVDLAMERILTKLDADDSVPTDPDQFMQFAKMLARSECLDLVSEIVKRDKESGKKEQKEDFSTFFPGAEDAVRRAQKDYEEHHKDDKKTEEDEAMLNILAAVAASVGVAAILALNIWNIVNKHKQK